MIQRFLWICLAGAVGTALRYLIGVGAARVLGTSFPFGTLIVNVVGCFLISSVMHVSLATELVTPTLRLALTTGFLGGFTTYSSFNYETTRLFEERAWGAGLLNLSLTVLGCFAAGLLGLAAAKRLFG
jgi:CrcB protein